MTSQTKNFSFLTIGIALFILSSFLMLTPPATHAQDFGDNVKGIRILYSSALHGYLEPCG